METATAGEESLLDSVQPLWVCDEQKLLEGEEREGRGAMWFRRSAPLERRGESRASDLRSIIAKIVSNLERDERGLPFALVSRWWPPDA